MSFRVFLLFGALLLCPAERVLSDDLSRLASDIPASDAAKIAKRLQEDPDTDLLSVLQAMKGKDEVRKNWLLSVAQTVADRNPSEAAQVLEQFLPRLSEDANARYWAFVYLTREDQQRREKLLGSMLADPCLELRFEAVAQGMRQIEEQESMSSSQRVSGYQELLDAARLPAQIQAIAKKLGDLDVQVDLLSHFGFLREWKAVAPFDNVDGVGFDKAYAPEQAYANGKLDLAANYEGKQGQVGWVEVSTEAQDGSVDLAEAFDKAKGAVAYLYGEFNSGSDLNCEVRIGSPNGTKVWVNGELVISREVYHAGNQIDQYVAPVLLKRGTNTILIKSCQNEMTQDWAQDWAFQLRFTDSSGFPIQPAS